MNMKSLATCIILTASTLFGSYAKSQECDHLKANPRDKYAIMVLGDAYDEKCEGYEDRFVSTFSAGYQSTGIEKSNEKLYVSTDEINLDDFSLSLPE